MKNLQSICSWIGFLISLVQFLQFIMLEGVVQILFLCLSLFLLNSWLYIVFLSSIAVSWSLLSMVCSILISSCNSVFTDLTLQPFYPESVLSQFTLCAVMISINTKFSSGWFHLFLSFTLLHQIPSVKKR